MRINGLMGRVEASAAEGVNNQLVFAEDIPGAIGALADCLDTDPELLLPKGSIEFGKHRIAARPDHQGVEFGIQLNKAGRVFPRFLLLVNDALEGVDLGVGHGLHG